VRKVISDDLAARGTPLGPSHSDGVGWSVLAQAAGAQGFRRSASFTALYHA